MTFILSYIVVGALLVVMALVGSVLQRLPLTATLLYLVVGFGLGPTGYGLIQLDPVKHAELLEHVTEVSVIISLFTTGLKLRTPLLDLRWRLVLRLAFGSMILTIILIALVGVVGLGLPIGAALLLGGILTPTDPVLAADVEVKHPWDQEQLRFGLTGEAALNDGTNSPFVLLGLGLLGVTFTGCKWVALASSRCGVGDCWRSGDRLAARNAGWAGSSLSPASA